MREGRNPSICFVRIDYEKLGLAGIYGEFGLEVVEQHGALMRLLTPVLDDDAGAVDDFAGVAFAVDLACQHDPY